ncbi:hypothetical protein M3J09_004766 [Ascochyta lentis]
MRLSILALALTTTSLATAQLTYNLTQALKPGNFAKYRCLDNDKLLALMPPTTAQCLKKCQLAANKADGCAENDFACHCVNYTTYSNLVEPCAFPPSGSCTFELLGPARPVIQDMCNFFNATLYADYRRCPQTLSRRKTYGIIAEEEVECST